MNTPGDACHDGFRPGRVWSLWDMISAQLTGLAPLIYQLSMYDLLSERHDGQGNQPINEREHNQATGWLRIASEFANDFELKSVHDRIDIFRRKLEKPLTWNDLGVECRVLRETIEMGLKGQLIYRYPNEWAVVLWRWQDDWKAVIEKFPSAKEDIRAAVDCWALGHGTAGVFHLMRVLEYGLTVLAADLGKDVGVQNWQNVIDQIESEIRNLGKTLPRGIEKSDRLLFLSQAAKELVYFKDGWRNYVSHNRGTYDQYQARSAMEHVRSFMTVLASRLSEASP